MNKYYIKHWPTHLSTVKNLPLLAEAHSTQDALLSLASYVVQPKTKLNRNINMYTCYTITKSMSTVQLLIGCHIAWRHLLLHSAGSLFCGKDTWKFPVWQSVHVLPLHTVHCEVPVASGQARNKHYNCVSTTSR